MSNLLDYLAWRGDLALSADGWNEIDALAMAMVCYNDFPDAAIPGARWSVRELACMQPPVPDAKEHVRERMGLLERMAASNRLSGLMLHDFVNEVDTARSIQFSALTADSPDGSVFVAFRGTDSTLVGWKEDFMMAFETPVPAQTAAAAYLTPARPRRRASRPYIASTGRGWTRPPSTPTATPASGRASAPTCLRPPSWGCFWRITRNTRW